MSLAVLLAVNDRPDNLFVLEQVVGAYLPDIKIITAESAEAGLSLAATEAIDGALIDVQMPGMNGIEMCRRLKADPRTAPIHVILVTAHGATSALKAQGLEAGADDCITKPIDNVEMAAKLRVMLRLRAAEKALRRERDHLEEAVQERTKELREAENRYRTLFHAAADAIFIHELEGGLLEVNEQACRCLGYERDELLHLTVDDFSTAENLAHGVGRLEQLRTTGHLLFETELITRNGGRIPSECSCRLIEFRGLPAALCIARDITERKEAEEALKLSEKKFRLLYDKAPLSYQSLDENGLIIEVNQTWLDVLGYSREEVIGHWFGDFLTPGFVNRFEENFPCFKEAGEIFDIQFDMVRKNGSLLAVSFNGKVAYNEQGQFLRTHCLFADITDRIRAEEVIRKREQELQSIFSAAPVGIGMSINQNFMELNDHICHLTGFSRDELLGQSARIFHPSEQDYQEIRSELYRQLGQTGQATLETTWHRKDGSRFDVSLCASPLVPGNLDAGITFTAADITERRQAEEALRSSAQKWRLTFDAIGDAVCLLDRDLNITQCNQAMVNLAGKPFAEIIGRTCREILLDTPDAPEGCACVRMSKSRQRETYSMPLNDRWYQAVAHPILNEAGEFSGGVYIIADVTDYRRANKKIKALNSLLKTIKEIDEALLRVQSEPELFRQTCDLLLKVPCVRFAWIGLAQPESRNLNIVAHAGHEEGYLAAIKVSSDDTEFGQGPSGEAMRTQRPVIIQDMESDPGVAPWREEARKRGYRASIALPLVCQDEMVGVLKVYSGKPDVFGPDEIEFLNQVAGDIAVGIKSIRLEQEVIQNLIKFQIVVLQTVEAIASMAEMRDPYTAGHQRGVTQLACALGKELGLDADRVQGVRVAGLLHDIGKIVVPAEILNKPGKISQLEMNIIKTHPQAGYDILQKINFPWPVAQIVLQHHERTNGSGYPQGLVKDDILLEARILAVADVVEAMAAHRPYRPALGLDRSLEELSKNKGILYDPEVVDACIQICSEGKFTFE
ncbi:MAG: PAS domain S-box protein [Desulfobaccales bacterium]